MFLLEVKSNRHQKMPSGKSFRSSQKSKFEFSMLTIQTTYVYG
jgi:hypothetical protein